MRFEIIIGCAISICLLLGSFDMMAQSRIYFSVGAARSKAGSFYFATHSVLPTAEVEFEKKLIGSFSLLTGLSWFGVDYSDDSEITGSTSKFSARYLAVPLLVRWNIKNKNSFYFDFGLHPYYLLNARLEESIIRFGEVREVQGDITAYSNSFFMSTRFQLTKAFNRVTISIFVYSSLVGQSAVKDLGDHWALNQQQSPYLASNGYSDFVVQGLKVGMRIK